MFSTTHSHPMLVHFPIALILFGFLALFISLTIKKDSAWSKTAFYALIFGTLSAFFSWLTGQLFTGEMTGPAGEVKETHELFANITLSLLILTTIVHLLLNKNENLRMKHVMIVLYTLAAISVAITGFYGGTLVYLYLMPL